MHRPAFVLFMMLLTAVDLSAQTWPMHTIDGSSRGADGVRLADVDQDGRTDIATAWEEGGQIRVCFRPESAVTKNPWPSIAVGNVNSPEDAVFADVDGDGWLDVVSCCEGSEQAVYFHLNPGNDSVRDAPKWQTLMLPESRNVTRWMFCEPLASARTSPPRLVFGSKNPNGRIALWTPDGRDDSGKLTTTGKFTTIRQAEWIMSLRRFDVDADGDDDIVYSDRKGARREIGWLENVSVAGSDAERWDDHSIGATGLQVMFLDVVRPTDGESPVLVCDTQDGHLQLVTPSSEIRAPWKTRRIAHPPNAGIGKAVALGDIDGNGTLDIVATCEHAEAKVGVYWLSEPLNSSTDSAGFEQWTMHDISGTTAGVKFDRIELLDLDNDGDLDVLTCEERDNLGVIWYENPRL